MTVLLEQLCVESSTLMDSHCLELSRKIMERVLWPELDQCDRKKFIWIFTHVAALSIQINEALHGEKPLSGERWAEFISNNLKVH